MELKLSSQQPETYMILRSRQFFNVVQANHSATVCWNEHSNKYLPKSLCAGHFHKASQPELNCYTLV